MAISSTAVLFIAKLINIVHVRRSMLINHFPHHTSQQEIPTGLTALGMTCIGRAFRNAGTRPGHDSPGAIVSLSKFNR